MTCNLTQPASGVRRPASSRIPTLTFLEDVLICSLGAYGGPEAHFGVFMHQMVAKRKYLTEEDLIELMALCSILPGPTSTQTIVAIGHKTGGPLLALLTMLVWSAPALLVMTAVSFLYAALAAANVTREPLRFVGPMAVGFIILAAYRIGRKVLTDRFTIALLIASAVSTYFIRAPWTFPLVLLAGGTLAILTSKEKDIWNHVRIDPPWGYLVAFTALALGSIAAAHFIPIHFLSLFDRFYRYGYLVFGGGQVIVPVMHSELVVVREYMTNAEFLTGYGLVQGLPGPMFSFSAYAGGLAARGGTVWHQLAGATAGGIGIFLPGLLLIYFVYPVWSQLRQIRAIRISLRGINAVAGGMIVAAAIILIRANGFAPGNLAATAITLALLATRKVPAPLLVVLALLAGVFL
jgi:chromate transporter